MIPDREWSSASLARLRAAVGLGALALALGFTALAQQPAQQAAPNAPDQSMQPSVTPSPASAPAPAPASPAEPSSPPRQPAEPTPQVTPQIQANARSSPEPGGITEEEIKRIVAGKILYLRGGYLDDTLTFNEHGALIGHSPVGSYTLCGVEIDKVRLTKHKLELEGARYGLHFLGALPYEDPTKAVDRVKITPRKKLLRITIDREVVVKPKRKKEKETEAKPALGTLVAVPAAAPNASQKGPSDDEPSDAEQAKAEMAAAPAEERPADPGSVTTTTSPAHAAKLLKDALDNVFAEGLDGRMMAAMPDFWKLYYQAAANKTDYRPSDPSVLRQNTVDTKAKLLTTFEPGSNDYAQSSGVAGMALYHAVVGVDGQVDEIAVARPIGFGLDENAVAAIKNAKFSPAIKNGKPVPVLLDMEVTFRIYSKRTAITGSPDEAEKLAEPALPGPYSVEHPQPAQPQQSQQ